MKLKTLRTLSHIGFIIFIVGLFLTMTYQNTEAHENVHKAICEYSGGNVTEYHVGLFGGYVICDIENRTSEQFLADTFNEAITYNNQTSTQLLFGVVALLGFLAIQNIFSKY